MTPTPTISASLPRRCRLAAVLVALTLPAAAQPAADWQNNGTSIYYDAGAVGIGITAPVEMLEVGGTVKALEVVVTQENWPDFVFAEGYELRPLDEVEAWIRNRGHLPGIPSAEEVATDGVGVGEMQAALLRKVEELTLYLLELRRENRELTERVAVLENGR